MNTVVTRRNALLSLCAAFAFAAFMPDAAAQQSGQQGQQGQQTQGQQGQQGKQGSQASKSGTQQTAKASPNAPPVAGLVPLGVTRVEADLVTPGYRASKLMKQDVYNDQNQKIGKIEDLVIAPDGTLSVAVIDVGGFAGIARHRVAIPVKQFTQMQPRIILPSATKDALKALPEFVPA
jgi:sporulation protein YlmC with PRC-barrel domain